MGIPTKCPTLSSVVVLSSLGLLAAGYADAATYNVTGTADGPGFITGTGPFDASTLRAAIAAANSNLGADTIVLPAGTYTLTIVGGEGDSDFSPDLDITDSVTIEGAGAGQTIIDGGGLDRVLHVFMARSVINRQSGPVISLSGITIQNGQTASSSGGGGILVQGGIDTVALSNCQVINNTVNSPTGGVAYGGGISASSADLTLDNCLIEGNQAVGNPGSRVSGSFSGDATGGGIALTGGSATITNTAIVNNAAYGGNTTSEGNNFYGGGTAYGGGIFTLGGMTLTNTTLSGNRAQAGNDASDFYGGNGLGGAITVFGASVNIFNTTIANNEALASDEMSSVALAGGVLGENASIDYQSSLVATNTAPQNPDLRGSNHNSLGFNLIGIVGAEGNLSNALPSDNQGSAVSPIDPLLGPLTNNGGDTPTHALLPGSPALNVGANSDPVNVLTDQRGAGFPRTVGAGTDVGAFEAGPVDPEIFRDGFESTD